jgi:hypothetical protein
MYDVMARVVFPSSSNYSMNSVTLDVKEAVPNARIRHLEFVSFHQSTPCRLLPSSSLFSPLLSLRRWTHQAASSLYDPNPRHTYLRVPISPSVSLRHRSSSSGFYKMSRCRIAHPTERTSQVAHLDLRSIRAAHSRPMDTLLRSAERSLEYPQ